MFYQCESFNQNLDTWNVSNVHDFTRMFYNAEEFNQDLTSWNIDGSINFSEMLVNSKVVELPSWYKVDLIPINYVPLKCS
jgi:surface protein